MGPLVPPGRGHAERGRVVMSGAEDKPLLILDRKGKGRVALLTSDHAWLWARGYDGGGPHTDLLRRLSHWLMKEPDLEEERLIASAKGLKLTLERRSMEDTVGPVKVLGPGGDTSDVTLQPVPVEAGRLALDDRCQTSGPLQNRDGRAVGHADGRRQRRHRRSARNERGDGDGAEDEADRGRDGRRRFLDEAGGPPASSSATDVDVPRISMMSAAKVMAGSGWLGLKDRQAFLTRGVKLTPMFTGLAALSALLALIALAWWREGR